MSDKREKPGCMKTGCFGCLGIAILLILIVGINLLVAWSRLDDSQMQNRELSPALELNKLPTPQDGIAPPAGPGGRVLLDLSQGEFHIIPAAEGEGLSVQSRYDKAAYLLEEDLSTAPDGQWTYTLEFKRNMPILQAIFLQLMGEGNDPYVKVYLPRNVPIELGALVQEGGLEADLGGLWLTEAEIIFRKGGFSLEVSEPLQEPLERLKIDGAMGGFEADYLGNASPKIIDVQCRMGGAEIDLRGQWLNDCNLDMSVKMGGMAVLIPEDVQAHGVPSIEPGPLKLSNEVPLPQMNFSLNQKWGEIEVVQ